MSRSIWRLAAPALAIGFFASCGGTVARIENKDAGLGDATSSSSGGGSGGSGSSSGSGGSSGSGSGTSSSSGSGSGSGGGGCYPATCPGGCCSNDTCIAGSASNACGTGGFACLDCTAMGLGCFNQACASAACTGCTGCCMGGTCLPGLSDQACGLGGAACANCASQGSACVNGACRGGGVCGTCTTDSQCQSACPPVQGGGTNCCDPGSGVCYATTQSTCPCDGTVYASLTVLNYMGWCSVAVVGAGAASTAAMQTLCVAPGSLTVVATPASPSFAIGADPWFGVDQNDGGAAPGMDMGSGATETSTATVTVTPGSHCVSVCCGVAPGGTGCPAVDPCP